MRLIASQANDIVSSSSNDKESGECDSSTETFDKKRSLPPSASEQTGKSEMTEKR